MSHVIEQKRKLLARVRRIRGQVEGLERALDAEQGCAEVLHQIAAIRGAINGLMAEVVEGHVQFHVAAPDLEPQQRSAGAAELIAVIRSYIK